jgi:selenium-binding protein 1
MAEGTDPTFYRSPAAAIAAPPERLAYVAALDPAGSERDAMTVVDCDAASPTYGEVVGWTDLPTADGRQRVAPLRVERLLQRALPQGSCPQRRARAPLT